MLYHMEVLFMVQIKIGITEQMKAQLRQEAKDTGLSMSECVRMRLTKSYKLEEQSYQSEQQEIKNNDRK